MQKRSIGSLQVSVIGLGCNNFGPRIDFEATTRVLHSALDNGINFFDTADMYGATTSEEYMGRALKGRRDEYIIATKFGMEVNEDQKGGAKPTYIREAIEGSLKRLQIDCIDLYQLHTPDPETPISETLETLDKLVQEGKVREIGCSNFSVEQLREAEQAVRSGAAKFVSVQNEFSLLRREAANDVIPECERTGMAFLPYFPLFSGVLTGKYRLNQEHPKGTRLDSERGKQRLIEENLKLIESLIEFAESRNHTILELAFSWILAYNPVASVIAGATKTSQIESNAKAANWQLTDVEVEEVNKLLQLQEATSQA